MDVTVLMNPRCTHRRRVEQALEEAARLQSYFRVKPDYVTWLPNDVDEKESVDSEEVHEKIARRFPNQYVIAITQSGIEPGDLFVDDRRHTSLVTVGEWEDKFAPPPLKIYLLFQIASTLLHFAADLSDEQIDNLSHKPAIGCTFDWYMDPNELKRCMIAANICGTCEVYLAEMGIKDEALASVEQLLGFVRAATMRRPRTTPTAVFIGHGHSKVWEEVRDFVTDTLKLPVQEFNQDAAAGISTTERLQFMLNTSAFAILVMTGEDLHKAGDGVSLHARENVVHETGLFQGRLGFHRAIILLEEGLVPFSNIHGLTRIAFPKGNFSKATKAKTEVRRAMEREGVLRGR